MAEPIPDYELDNLRAVAARLDAGAPTSSLDKAFALVCLPGAVARLDAVTAERDTLRRVCDRLLYHFPDLPELLAGPGSRKEAGKLLDAARKALGVPGD